MIHWIERVSNNAVFLIILGPALPQSQKLCVVKLLEFATNEQRHVKSVR